MKALCFAFLCIIAAASAAPLTPSDISRKFQGTFKWADREDLDTLTLTISSIKEKDGLLHFAGMHDYDDGAARMKVSGIIDPATRKVVLKETEIVVDYYSEIDGQFLGTLSEDGRVLEAEWTTTSTGRKGQLKLKAK